ncbi:HET-domain-containing protein [Xylariaceae sp. AK1471]|nr:HET-domain-containing protein [Xylariaceae sp. AK1471]
MSPIPNLSAVFRRIIQQRPVSPSSCAFSSFNRSFGQYPQGEASDSLRYSYRSLCRPRDVRLLILRPESDGGDVAVGLEHSSLDSRPTYDALSYTWDDPYAPSLVHSNAPTTMANGKLLCSIRCGDRPVLVAPNLYLALRRLRKKSEARVLWVDALCINQADENEKAQQIPLMRPIYSEAQSVIVWVGEEDSWTPDSKDTINRWAHLHRTIPSSHPPELLRHLKESSMYTYEQLSFEVLIRRAWFTRSWTFQELCLARSARILCGTHSIPWEDFRDACAIIIRSGQSPFVFEEHENIHTLYDFWDLCKTMPEQLSREADERFQLSRLLQRARTQQATDPRDKLYSLLGVAKPPVRNDNAYAISYKEPVQRVFTRFTRDMIREDGDLGVLSLVKTPHQGKTKDYKLRQVFREDAAEDGSLDNMTLEEQDQHENEMLRSMRIETAEELRNNDNALSSPMSELPSWVPDYAWQDRIEYIAQDNLVRVTSSPTRTKFPRPIAQHYSDGWPRYWTNKQFSYRSSSEDITFETGIHSQLGVHGIKIDTVKEIYEIPFVTDPSIRVFPTHEQVYGQAEERAEIAPPSPPRPLNFNFQKRLWLEHGSSEKANSILLHHTYYPTREDIPLALLRTLAADMLPISSRLPDEHKRVDFPHHYDWHFWNFSTPKLLSSSWSTMLLMPFLFPLQVWFMAVQVYSLWSARGSVQARGASVQEDWTAFDANELRRARRIRVFYRHVVLGRKGDSMLRIGQETPRGIGTFAREYSYLFWVLPAAVTMGLMKGVWNQFIVGTVLSWVPLEVPWVIVAGACYYFGVYLPRRSARPFERSPSVPAGWDSTAYEVALEAQALEDAGFSSDSDGLKSLWGIACEIQNAINRASWNRHFFTTENGYMGIGPVGVKPGDEVWSLIGGHVPFVLRPADHHLGRSIHGLSFQMVGECYVHGIMNGEAWKGCKTMRDMKVKAQRLILI